MNRRQQGGGRPRSKRQTTLYCFSPPVMIATCVIEVGLALHTLWRYKMGAVSRLATLLLLFLATFQLAEFMVCRGVGDGLLWSRVGFAAITTLPPLGLHLTYAVAGAKRRWLLWPAYLSGAAFLAFFSLIGRSIDGHACLGNYVIFQIAPGFGWLYGAYYYVWLIAALALGWRQLRCAEQRRKHRALAGLMFGYAIFLLPTTTVNFLKPETMAAIPSVMCGFAVLLALMLGFVVLPAAALKRKA